MQPPFLAFLATTPEPPAEFRWWQIIAFAILCTLEVWRLVAGKQKATREELKEAADQLWESLSKMDSAHDILNSASQRKWGEHGEAIQALKEALSAFRAELNMQRISLEKVLTRSKSS